MNIYIRRSLFIFILLCPYILVFLSVENTHPDDIVYAGLRLSGLFGFLSLSLGVIMNLFKKEMKTTFGRPFMVIHHFFAISGLILITIHPVLLAFATMDLSVFIPITSSVLIFLVNGGRVAIILLYLGFLTAVFRSAFKGSWIQIHRIMYLALILGIIHANLLGQDLADPVIWFVVNTLAGIAIITGIMKMRNRHRLLS